MSSWKQRDTPDFLILAAEHARHFLDGRMAGVVLFDRATGKMLDTGYTEEAAREIQEIQHRLREGPLVDAIATRRIQLVPDIEVRANVWPTLTRKSLEIGTRAGAVLPLVADDAVIGAINVGITDADDLAGINAGHLDTLARLVTETVGRHEAYRTAEEAAQHLQRALDADRTIEQAVGSLSRALSVTPARARELIRVHARSARTPMRVLAEEILNDPTAYLRLVDPK